MVAFVPQVDPGNGADGIAVLFGSPGVPDTNLGSSGWGLGFAPVGAHTYAVIFSEDKEVGAPAMNSSTATPYSTSARPPPDG